jgi:hypothetical protein
MIDPRDDATTTLLRIARALERIAVSLEQGITVEGLLLDRTGVAPEPEP